MTRREFLYGSTALGATAWADPLALPASAGAAYTVAVLGDTHYDVAPESVYHSHYDESNRWAKVQHEEFRRNGEMWANRCRRMLAASGELAAREPTDFVLQLGDLIQGDCDDVATHKKMMADAVQFFRAAYPAKLPFLTVLGNHDVRGKGARAAYLDFAGTYMARELGRSAPVRYPVFSWRKGPDLWVFCDFEMEDLKPLMAAIEADPAARHVFVVTHGPFTPCESQSIKWRLGGQRSSDAARPALYELLSRRRAIVLSGHTHKTAFYRHENAFGGFGEFVFNSVWCEDELATAKAENEGAAEYGKWTRSLGEAKRLADFEAAAAPFRKGLTEHYHSLGAGHYRLAVAADRVTVAYYPGDARSAARSFVLKG